MSNRTAESSGHRRCERSGLDLLHQLADLVLDSWLDLPQLRIYNAQQLAERVAAEGANVVVGRR